MSLAFNHYSFDKGHGVRYNWCLEMSPGWRFVLADSVAIHHYPCLTFIVIPALDLLPASALLDLLVIEQLRLIREF